MTVSEQVPFEALDDEAQRTPAWETLLQQRGDAKVNAIPNGTFEATLLEVAVVKRRDNGGHVIRMVAVTERLGRYLLAWRGLSEDPSDPYALTDAQVKGLRKFADGMGIRTPALAVEIVEALQALRGEQVMARVVHTPVGAQASFTRTESAGRTAFASTSLVNGHAVNGDGELRVGTAAAAFEAHGKLLGGLGAARLGLAQAAEGAYTLRESEGWTDLGFTSLGEYLASPEITLSRRDFYDLAQIWRAYVVDGGVGSTSLSGAAQSKLHVPLPALQQGLVSAERAVADATTLTQKDLREHYRTLLGGDENDDPKLSAITVVDSQPTCACGAGCTDGACTAQELGEYDRRGVEDGEDDLDLTDANLEAAYMLGRREADEEVERLREQEMAVLSAASAAREVTVVLRRVLSEIGDPKQKRMGRELRAAVLAALDLAHEHGLDVEGES